MAERIVGRWTEEQEGTGGEDRAPSAWVRRAKVAGLGTIAVAMAWPVGGAWACRLGPEHGYREVGRYAALTDALVACDGELLAAGWVLVGDSADRQRLEETR